MSLLPKTICLYARVSSELQEERGTIHSQIDELKRHISQNGDVLVKEYVDDGYSGELLERPALDELRNDAAKQLWTKVYVLSPDRLARKPHIAGLVIDELNGHGVDVLFVNRPLGDTIEDRLLFGIQSLFAEYEKEKIKERQRRGKLFKAKRGHVVGGKAPYGYSYRRDSGTGTSGYETNPTEAKVVRLIYDWYTSGQYSYRRIAKELYTKGIKTRTGRSRWTHAVISTILTDSTYAGTTYYNKRRRIPPKRKPGQYRRSRNTARVQRDKGEWIAISVPSIISSDQYEKAQAIKAQNVKHSPRHAKEKYLFKNLTRCGQCQSAMYGSYTLRSNSRYCFYQCSLKQRRDPLPTDHRLTIRRDLLDSLVWGELSKVLSSPQALVARLNAAAKKRAASTEELSTELREVQSEQERVLTIRQRTIEAYSASLLSLEEFERATEKFNATAAELTVKEAQLKEQLGSAPEAITVEAAKALLTRYTRNLEDLSFEGKRKIVEALVQSVVVNQNQLEVQCRLPAMPRDHELQPIEFGSSIRPERNSGHVFELIVPLPA